MPTSSLLLGFLAGVTGFSSMPMEPACETSARYRTVIHVFKEGTSGAWNDWFSDSTNFNNFLAQNEMDGTYMHYFMPSTDGTTINCLWETSSCWSDEDFQAWIDGPTGPGYMPPTAPMPYDNVFVNTPYRGTAAIVPPPHFPDPPAVTECKAPAGSVYFVKHYFEPNALADTWIDNLATFNPEEYQAGNMANGVHNPQFILLSTDTTDGHGSPDAMCVWETESPMTPEEFQTFIDGPTGPGEGVFTNVPYQVVPGTGKQPCSAF